MRHWAGSKTGKNGVPPPQTRYNASKTPCANARGTAKKQNHRRRKKTTTTTRKRRRQTHQLNTTEYQIRHLFTQPTDAQYSTAAVALERTPHAHAIQSLREHAHISSAAIDEILILLIRPRLPPNTALLLCHDSYFMPHTDMPIHQKRARNVINTHSTTLIPLFDSAHWFLVEVNTDTRTFTFYNSYGKHGQRKHG